MKKWVPLLGLSVVVIGAVGFFVLRQTVEDVLGGKDCTPQAYRDLVDPLLDRWKDAEELARQTPRSSLPDRLSEMQAIKREIENLDVPVCALGAHLELMFYCGRTLDAFLAFMRQMSDDEITDDDIGVIFAEANDHLDDWVKLVSEIE